MRWVGGMITNFYEKNIKNPSTNFFRSILEKFLEFFSGKPFQKLCQPKIRVLEYFDYPELHEESTIFIIQHRFLQEITKFSGVEDFSVIDYNKIDYSRVKLIFYRLVTFAKFKEKKILYLKKFNKSYFGLRLSNIEIGSKVRLINEKISFFQNNFFHRFVYFQSIKPKKRKKSIEIKLFFLEIFYKKKKDKMINSKSFFFTEKSIKKKKEKYNDKNRIPIRKRDSEIHLIVSSFKVMSFYNITNRSNFAHINLLYYRLCFYKSFELIFLEIINFYLELQNIFYQKAFLFFIYSQKYNIYKQLNFKKKILYKKKPGKKKEKILRTKKKSWLFEIKFQNFYMSKEKNSIYIQHRKKWVNRVFIQSINFSETKNFRKVMGFGFFMFFPIYGNKSFKNGIKMK